MKTYTLTFEVRARTDQEAFDIATRTRRALHDANLLGYLVRGREPSPIHVQENDTES